MTAKEAKAAGYQVIKASPFEVGLVHKEKGVRTWWAKDFGGRMPGLDHWLVQEAIEINERWQVGTPPA
jgi:hypothetical protein